MEQKTMTYWRLTLILAIIGSFCVQASAYLSPTAIVASNDSKTLYIAERTAEQIAVFDVASEKVLKTIDVKASVSGLAISHDDSKLYVTIDIADGGVAVIDLKKSAVTKTIPTGHTAMSPMLSPDGKKLYVCNRFNHNISIIDLAAGKEIWEVPVVRQPIDSALTLDGKTLFVANFLPAGATDGEFASSEISVIDTETKEVSNIQLVNGSMAVHGMTLSPNGKYVYVTQVLGRFQLPTTQLERGWMNTNAMTIIDTQTKKAVNTVLLDDVDLGAANPWDIACTDDGKYIVVTLAGTHQITVIDSVKMHAKLDKVAAGEKVSDVSSSYDDVPNDLSFLAGMRKRINLKGNGPRAIAMIGNTAYVPEYFTDSMTVVDVLPSKNNDPKAILLGEKLEMTEARKGEMHFHDADFCFQKWQSCATCHPSEGRPDALNWDLLNDGMGNPKNTKSLLFSHVTAPAMVTGIRDTAEIAVRAGIRYIQFSVRPEEDAAAIDEYLKSLKPIPSPYLVKNKLSKSAKRGQMLFKSSGCASCHSGPYLTDLNKYDIGTGINMEVGIEFDTPTLVEVWQTSPYLHDGRAVTIQEVLTKFNKKDMHGITSHLTEKQIADLAEYVLSL